MTRSVLDAERARTVAWLAIGVYIAALAAASVLRTQGDFNIYYRAGQRVLAGVPIYRLDEKNHFLYAPVFAIGFAPFAALPLKAAQFAWSVVSAAGLLALILGSSRMLFGPGRRLDAILIIVPVLLAARFIDNNIEHGQINLPTLALVVWGLIFGEEDRPVPSGAMLAAAILIKPFAILAILFLILERRWRPVLFSAVFGAILIAAPAMLLGVSGAIDQTIAYAQVVLSMKDRYTLMLTNQSAVSAFARVMSVFAPAAAAPAPSAIYLGTALELAMAATVTLWYRRTSARGVDPMPPHRMELAALFCIMPSLVPVSWKSYYAALLVPYMLLTALLWSDRDPEAPQPIAAWVLVAISVILNWIPGTRPNRVALFYSAHFLSSIVVLAALALLARARADSRRGQITGARAANG